jgi:hypothetical protein
MLKDRYGNPLSTHSRAAADKYDQALELIRLYRGDPIARSLKLEKTAA